MSKKILLKNTQNIDIIKFENIKSMFDDDFKRIVFSLSIDFEVFKAQIDLDAEEADFIRMKESLEKVYNNEWKFPIIFNPIDEQFTIQFKLQEDGQIKVYSKLSNPMFTGTLKFEYLTDQSFLPELIQEIEAVIKQRLFEKKIFLHENFYVDTDCRPTLSQLFDKIKQYGYEYFELLRNEDNFFKLLQEGHPLVAEKSEFNLPVLYYLRGEKQKGLACIENEINKRNQRKTDEQLLEENIKSLKLVESINDQVSSERKNIVVVRSDGQKQLYDDIMNNRVKKPKDTILVLTSGAPSGISEYYLKFAEAYRALP